ncbi:MAG: type II toxin-antitoxin system HicB family antitoxin [Hydrogenophilales bacterium]|nr:type II toxin-antitoxin system HicB family antitoxin [Hydrogenophilales bacterium]
MSKAKFEDYPFDLRPLAKAEGGGWLITWPDLDGCMSDGETPEAAIQNGRDAFSAWMAVRGQDLKRPAPKPSRTTVKPARFVLRTPQTLHARLVARAQAEGVSLNTLVTSFIAESLGKNQRLGAKNKT